MNYKTQRTREGVKHALEHGTKSGRPFGRPAVKLPYDFAENYSLWRQGLLKEINLTDLWNISRATLYRWVKQYESRA